jgi:hypothetical protein
MVRATWKLRAHLQRGDHGAESGGVRAEAAQVVRLGLGGSGEGRLCLGL